MPNKQNVQSVKDLTEKLKGASSIVFMDYKGMTSNQTNDLRKKLAETDAELEVARNTLLKISLKESGLDISQVEKSFEGATAAIISRADAISPIKKLFEFIKTATLPVVKLGFLDGRFYNSAEVETLSKLPSKQQLIAQILSGFNSPISGFVNVLSGTKRNFVYALGEISKKKSQG